MNGGFVGKDLGKRYLLAEMVSNPGVLLMFKLSPSFRGVGHNPHVIVAAG